MLSFLNDTLVETPCLDFFKKMPETAFSQKSKWEQTLLKLAQTTQPCVYGDQTVGDKDKWQTTMEAEIICAEALHDFVHAYLGGQHMLQVFSKSLQPEIISAIDKKIKAEGTNALIQMVEDDFISRKIQKAYEIYPEVVAEHFAASYFMYQMKNIPTPLRDERDRRLFKCLDVFYNENHAEQHFANLYRFAIRQKEGQLLSVEISPMTQELFDRIDNAITWAPLSNKKERHAYLVCKRRLSVLQQNRVNTL